MPNRAINIYRATEQNEGWFELDVSSAFQRMVDATLDLLGNRPGNRVYLTDNPQPGSKARRVGRIFVENVIDDEVYVVETIEDVLHSDAGAVDLIGKPDIERKPDGDAGEWAIQSLIFDKEKFTEDQAREWISNHDSYGDYGSDETNESYHFRQYDPKWFELFRIITIADGVSAAYAQIKDAGDVEAQKADSEESFKNAIASHLEIRRLNKKICENGIVFLRGTQKETIKKTKNGEEEEQRFILGLVLRPTKGPSLELEPDTQDDVYTLETIRAAAHGWMENHGHVDLMHSWTPLGNANVKILESYLAPVDFTISDGESSRNILEGTWLVAMRILNDGLWQSIKDGKLGAYSIGGTANRDPLEEE